MPAAFDQALVRRAGNVWRRQGGLPLCDVCGVKAGCQLHTGLATLGEVQRARVTIPECGTFVPVVGFTDPRGLDGEFNTFRRGQGWAKRAVIGGRVGLYDLAAGAMVGFARVEGIHVGVLGELLQERGAANHLMKTVPEERAPEELHRVLRRAYGTTYAAASETFCVIEMRREE